MSTESAESQDSDPMSQESQISGILYYVNAPESKKLNLENLRSNIGQKEITNDISSEIEQDTIVPETFKNDNGEVIQRVSIYNTKIIERNGNMLLFTDIHVDNRNPVKYRGEEILTMDVYEASAVVLDHDGSHYIAVLAKRNVADEIVEKLRSELGPFGSSINETLLSPQALERIESELDADLINTIISDLPYEDLSKVELNGYGFEDTDLYESQQERGNVRNHLLNTEELVRDNEITLRVSDDGLIRIRNKVQLETFIRFLREHVLPYVGYKLEYSPSLGAYNSSTTNPVFTKTQK